MIDVQNLSFTYDESVSALDNSNLVLNNVSLTIERGEFIAILGSNGSGKSTLSRHFNALLQGQAGKVYVLGMDSADISNHTDIHRLCGMVFQNPDNQIVGTTVEEDVAFGLENLAIPPAEIRQRVDASLSLMQLDKFKTKSPEALSGGQKQKLALAGIIAMNPTCIVLDESTSMLDPNIRSELIHFIKNLQRQTKLTVVLVTHYMDEALQADRIFYMHKGEISRSFTPEEFFLNEDLSRLSLELPSSIALCKCLQNLYDAYANYNEESLYSIFWELLGEKFDKDKLELAFLKYGLLETFKLDRKFSDNRDIFELSSLSIESQTSFACDMLRRINKLDKIFDFLPKFITLLEEMNSDFDIENQGKEIVLEVKNLNYRYPDASENENDAILDISFDLRKGECLAIAGSSGSGKSTLILHLNGLIQPQSGSVKVLGLSTSDKKNFREIRKNLALLFQYPEHQLFAETLLEDIAFGPLALGYEKDEAYRLAKDTAYLLGFNDDDLNKSPFSFSGGQMRKAALAGVLSAQAEILVLDEPAAGLDPASRRHFMAIIELLKKKGKSIILVSHNVDEIAEYADRLIIMNEGKLMLDKKIREALNEQKFLMDNSLDLPSSQLFVNSVYEYMKKLDCVESGNYIETACKDCVSLNQVEAFVKLLKLGEVCEFKNNYEEIKSQR